MQIDQAQQTCCRGPITDVAHAVSSPRHRAGARPRPASAAWAWRQDQAGTAAARHAAAVGSTVCAGTVGVTRSDRPLNAGTSRTSALHRGAAAAPRMPGPGPSRSIHLVGPPGPGGPTSRTATHRAGGTTNPETAVAGSFQRPPRRCCTHIPVTQHRPVERCGRRRHRGRAVRSVPKVRRVPVRTLPLTRTRRRWLAHTVSANRAPAPLDNRDPPSPPHRPGCRGGRPGLAGAPSPSVPDRGPGTDTAGTRPRTAQDAPTGVMAGLAEQVPTCVSPIALSVVVRS